MAAAQVQGLCLGMLVGTLVHVLFYAWLWWATDWESEAAKALARSEVKMELSEVAAHWTQSGRGLEES